MERFQESWPLCALADARCRSEHWDAEHRRQSLFHDSSPELSAYVPERPWNSVIRESSNDRDFWKEELEDEVMDFRQVRAMVQKTTGRSGARKKSGAGRGLQRVQRRSNEAVLEGITHCEEAMDGIAPIPLTNKSASNSIGTLVDAQESVQRSEHTCVFSAWSLTVPWNVRGILGGGHHPKVRGRGSTRVRGAEV